MSSVVQTVLVDAGSWGLVYAGIGGWIRHTALSNLRRGKPKIAPYAGSIGQREREDWLLSEAPRYVARARLWYIWPVALVKSTDRELTAVEAEISTVALKRMTAERDVLEKRIAAEAARQRKTEEATETARVWEPIEMEDA